jgi:DNA-binding NtrC family response regulator
MKRVLLLDDDIDLCTILVEIIIDLGAPKCVCVHSVEDLQKIPNINSEFDIALLDVNLGLDAPSGFDAYDWLVQNNYRGEVAFFTGHSRTNPQVQRALEIPHAILLEKPANVSDIERLIS